MVYELLVDFGGASQLRYTSQGLFYTEKKAERELARLKLMFHSINGYEIRRRLIM